MKKKTFIGGGRQNVSCLIKTSRGREKVKKKRGDARKRSAYLSLSVLKYKRTT